MTDMSYILLFAFSFRMSKSKDEKKYAQIAPDTVNLLAETVGISGSTVSNQVARALSEDASYRCRALVNVNNQKLILYSFTIFFTFRFADN